LTCRRKIWCFTLSFFPVLDVFRLIGSSRKQPLQPVCVAVKLGGQEENMDLGIKDRVALVTASSKGLGMQAARALAAEGAKLSICARGKEALDGTAAALKEEFGGDVLSTVCDLTDEKSHFGRIDILVVNCGGPPSGAFVDHDADRWRSAVELNLMSAIYLVQEAVPLMIPKRWGRIVFSTSISVKQPIDGLILSNSVRAAVIGLSRTLANELGQHGILVNSVCPGFFLTDRVKELAEKSAEKAGSQPQDFIDRWAGGVRPAGGVFVLAEGRLYHRHGHRHRRGIFKRLDVRAP
jgi:3-oxoacyl-[acyl-carrier protein] reductase